MTQQQQVNDIIYTTIAFYEKNGIYTNQIRHMIISD